MGRWGRGAGIGRIRVLLLAVMVFVAAVVGYELYRIIIPFQTQNPLWSEATIGEPVINHWDYEGKNEEGYLQFRNSTSGTTAELPPGEKMLALDGKFVMIERAGNDAIVYATPLAAVPIGWWLLGVAAVAVLLLPIALRVRVQRAKAGFKTRRQKHQGEIALLMQTGFHASGPRKFRAKTKRWK